MSARRSRIGQQNEVNRVAALKAPAGAPASRPGVRATVIVVSAYIAAQMLADIASLKIGVVAGLAVDMGTFIYPITFTLRDLAHKVLGRAATRWLIAAAAVVNLFMAGYLMVCAATPSDPPGDSGLNRRGAGAHVADRPCLHPGRSRQPDGQRRGVPVFVTA